MARIIGVDSLAFISLDGLYRALGKPGRDMARPGYCDACFTGDYAIPLTDCDGQRGPAALPAAGQPVTEERPSPPLAGTVALVTGASRGIGAAVAVELARLGAHLVLTARSQGGLEETDDAIRAVAATATRGATLLPLDLVKDAEKLDMLGPSIVQRFGRLDILVHAAGVLAKLTPVAHIQPRDWQESVAVNLSACWRLIRSCDPPLRAAPAGRAVVLTDAVASAPRAYWGLYGAAKAGQEHLVRSLGRGGGAHAAPRVAVRPRPGRHAAARRRHARREPGDRSGRPADVAPAIAALCLPGEAPPPHGEVVPRRRCGV